MLLVQCVVRSVRVTVLITLPWLSQLGADQCHCHTQQSHTDKGCAQGEVNDSSAYQMILLQNRQPAWQQAQTSKLSAQYEDADSLTDTDLPAHQLADKDSLFVDCNGLQVHYKQACPVEVCLTARCLMSALRTGNSFDC